MLIKRKIFENENKRISRFQTTVKVNGTKEKNGNKNIVNYEHLNVS